MTTFPAITIWQPWASLIMAGAKPFEFRGWAAPRAYWGQRVAIHAGARPIHRVEMQELLLRLQSEQHAETGLHREAAITIVENALAAPGHFPRSAILCLATLGQPIRGEQLAAQLGLTHDSDRDEHSNFGWPLTDVQPLTPYVPARGSQGWWRWTMPQEIEAS
jgi:hypothetical protein